MTENRDPDMSVKRSFLVAGDVCLDVIGVPVPAPVEEPCQETENWKLTSEVRTALQPGGALLLTELLKQAAPKADVRGPQARWPTQLVPPSGRSPDEPLTIAEFLGNAGRLTRDDLVHSLLAVKPFAATGKKGEKRQVLRIEKCHGYSGPEGEPGLTFTCASHGRADVLVIDDTGNRLRKATAQHEWPPQIRDPGKMPSLVIYKLHRPLPSAKYRNAVWEAVNESHPTSRVVVVTVDDLRTVGAPISMGISWERTSLDVVWHLLNNESFALLRKCPWLVVRLGLEGAVVLHWRKVPAFSPNEEAKARESATSDGRTFEPRPTEQHQAWLVYDPKGIEGSFSSEIPGFMVACGSAFTAALAARFGSLDSALFDALRSGAPHWKTAPDAADKQLQDALLDGVAAALEASQQVLVRGFGELPDAGSARSVTPVYPPCDPVCRSGCGSGFARHAIPIIPKAETPDRGYWRLLESIFDGCPSQLHHAVARVAAGRKSPVKDLSPADRFANQEAWLLERAPKASYANLQTFDRKEIEQYRSLYTLLRDYLCNPSPDRPMSFAVFGPPGAGKSFGVKQVAESLKGQIGCKDVAELTFNLSLYKAPEDLAAAFHLVRDKALEGKVPLVFFDEFDTALGTQSLGWLRCFLAPMQDGKFLDRGSEHPIGQAIFVFAGGTSGTYREFREHASMSPGEFRAVKGPDFLSRLRATLDIPSLNLPTAEEPRIVKVDGVAESSVQRSGTFNPYGPTEDFPSTPAILLRRASILSFNLKKKAPGLERVDGSLSVDPSVLNALLFLPEFRHGNRSFEAILDMSHLAGAEEFTPALLPPPAQIALHADAGLFLQMLATPFLLPAEDRELLGQEIHERYRQSRLSSMQQQSSSEVNLRKWAGLPEDFRESSRQLADDIASKLRYAGLWIRKSMPESPESPLPKDLWMSKIEELARLEHDRFVAERRRKGWAPAASTSKLHRSDRYMLHNCLFVWSKLDEQTRNLDRDPVREIPALLRKINYEITAP